MRLRAPLLLLALSACRTAPPPQLPPPDPQPASDVAVVRQAAPAVAAKPELGPFGVDLAGMDRAVAPGDDFWAHVNGTWARTTEIPPDRGTLSQVARLNDVAAGHVRTLLEELLSRREGLAGEERQVAEYYAALVDGTALEARGTAPLSGDLARVRAVTTRSQLAALMGELTTAWMPTPPLGRMPRYTPAPLGLGVEQDSKAPDRYVVSLSQGGLGMPERDYYLKADAPSAATQEKYRAHLATLLQLCGVPRGEAARRAAAVYGLERALAQAHWSRAESRDADKTYNPWTREQLAKKAPGFDWEAFLGAAGVGAQPSLVVAQPSAVTGTAALLARQPLGVWKDWLTVRLAKDRALVLPKAFQDAELAFSNGVLTGAAEAPARWLQAVELTGAALPHPVSRRYVERHFPPATKAAMDALVKNVLAAMDARLQRLEWMAPETKEKARAKLAAFTPMVGYPEAWRDFAGLEVRAGDAYGNLVRAGRFEHARRVGRLGGPVDRREWWMMPTTANAYASFENNVIVFPAAYLQPPHFDPNADPAVNYGAIGYVIGHEISHHFDDQGSKFDPEGRLVKWWTPEDERRFAQLAQRLVAQYDTYEALPGLKVRGAQTLGENIADNAGLAVAYDAYRLSLGGKPAPVLEGFTGEQRFFLGRAQMNRVLFREPALRQQVISGVHSPSRFRTSSVRNHDGWYEAFGVQPGQALYLPPEQRVRIW
jgi:putative endopeptidase